MKFLRNILLCALIATSLVGCKKFLELKPEGAIIDTEAIKTPEDLQNLLSSCYDATRSGKYLGGQLWALSDMMADDLDGTLFTGDWGAFYNHRTSTFISAGSEVWQDPYLVIYRTNTLMEKMPELEGVSADLQKRFTGECRFLRALAHLSIVHQFGQPYGGAKYKDVQSGIPLRLKTGQEKVVRSTTEEVYNQVLADLEEAIQNLPENNSVYANKWAAKALKAKVYFEMNKIQEAYDLANDVVNNSGAVFEQNLTKRFSVTGASAEGIFKLVSKNTQSNSATKYIENYSSKNNPNPPIPISKDLLLYIQEDPKDIRDSIWLKVVTNPDGTRVFNAKANYLTGGYCDVPVIHLTEMKLLRAECAALLPAPNVTQALQDVNDIRQRAQLDPFVSSVPSAIVDEVRRQRRIEMFSEGNRLQDLKRIGAFYNPNLKIRNSPWDCPGMVAQIPNSEAAGNLDIMFNEQGGCN